MILPQFDVLVPVTIQEACSMLLEKAKNGARLIAGGTDILVDIRRPVIPIEIPGCDGCTEHKSNNIYSTIDCADWESKESDRELLTKIQNNQNDYPGYLISLHKIPELKGIEVKKDNSIRVKAMTTITEIERSAEVRRNWTALAEGADSLGSPLVRNRGTIGGNIANARPAADMLIPAVALGGTITLQSKTSSRKLAVEDFVVAPGKTKIKSGEILTEMTFPAPPPNSGSCYYKLANRKALEISNVGVAVWLSLKEMNGPVDDIRVALGAVGPTPILAESVKEELIGKIPTDDVIQKAAKAARRDARPIDDHRGLAEYRAMMVETLTEKMIRSALERAKGAS